MTKEQIIGEMAENRVVEKLAEIVGKGEDKTDVSDLIQDIYLDLFLKEEERIAKMYEDGEIEYFIYRMLANQIYSSTSPYYKKYKATKQFEELPYDQTDTDD